MLLAFLILRVSYTTSTLPTGKQLTRNSTWRSCDVCMNQFVENDRENGGMTTGSCTTTMRQLTLHILCSSFWPNTAPLSCSSRHTHQISHRVTFSYSQGLTHWKTNFFYAKCHFKVIYNLKTDTICMIYHSIDRFFSFQTV